jgi:Cdc6-like AAA superfamily ATPase
MGMLQELYRADAKRLNVIVAGQPGSGKSFFLEHTLGDYLKQSRLKNERFIYITPKQESILGLEITPMRNFEKALRKERIIVLAPEMETLEDDVDYIINHLFEVREANEEMTAAVIVDDSQIFLKSQGNVSPALKRLALTGRSRGIRGIFVSHTMILNKSLEGSVQYILNFTLPQPMFFKDAQKRYGYDPEPLQEELRASEYGYIWHDVYRGETKLMPPLEV